MASRQVPVALNHGTGHLPVPVGVGSCCFSRLSKLSLSSLLLLEDSADRSRLPESLLYVCIHLIRLAKPNPLEERNRRNAPAHSRQESISQAGVAEWLERVGGEVRRTIEFECNALIHDCKIDTEQPICCDVLELMRYAQSAQRLSDLSLTDRQWHLQQPGRLLRELEGPRPPIRRCEPAVSNGHRKMRAAGGSCLATH